MLYEIKLREAYNEGIEIGNASGLFFSVESLMETLHISKEESCKLLKCSTEEYETAKALIEGK